MQAISPASSLVDSLQLSVMPFGLTTVSNKLSSLFQFFGSSSETKTSFLDHHLKILIMDWNVKCRLPPSPTPPNKYPSSL